MNTPYTCNICVYETYNLSNYNKHLATKKHIENSITTAVLKPKDDLINKLTKEIDMLTKERDILVKEKDMLTIEHEILINKEKEIKHEYFEFIKSTKFSKKNIKHSLICHLIV